VSAHVPDNNGGIPLSKPESSIPNTEHSQVVKLQLDKSVAEVKSEVKSENKDILLDTERLESWDIVRIQHQDCM
jgi:hypothetical protein